MKSAAISELKAKLGEYLKRAQAGEEIIIISRGKPVAKIVPLGEGKVEQLSEEEASKLSIEEWQQYLVRTGRVRLGKKTKLPADFWERRLPPDPGDSILKALLEEREEGR